MAALKQREDWSLILHLAVAVGLAVVDSATNLEVDWVPAMAVGLAAGMAVRSPVLVTGTGTVVSVGAGLVLGVLWHHGLPTALACLALNQVSKRFFRGLTTLDFWLGGLLSLAGLLAAAGAASGLAAAGAPAFPRRLTAAVAYWLTSRLLEGVLRAREAGRPAPAEIGALLASTWWAIPVYLGGGLAVVATRGIPWLEAAVALGLALTQKGISAVVNGFTQDQAVTELLRRAGRHHTGRFARSERLLRYAQAMGRALSLPEADLRLLGYAALLQDIGGQGTPPPEAELALDPPDPDLRAALRAHAGQAAGLIRRVGPLRDVSRLVQFRYAWWDGRGEPVGAAGEAIPPGAQVLAAANALVLLEDPERAHLWLRAQSGRRLAPAVARAAEAALREEAAAGQDSPRLLPEAIRRLQSIGGPGTAWLPRPLARLLRPLHRRLGGAFGLPEEVMAVAQLSHVLNANTSLEGAMDVVMQAVSELTSGAVFVALATDAGDALVVRRARNFRRLQPEGMHLPLLGGPITRALARQEPVALYSLADEVPGPIARTLADQEGIRSCLALPLVARGRSVGMLWVGLDHYHWFSPREIGLLSLIAGQAALAVDNSRLLAQAEERLQRVDAIKRLLDQLIENLPAGVLLLDTGLRVLVVNRVANEILARSGYPRVEPGQVFQTRRPDGPLGRILAGEDAVNEIWSAAPDLVLELRTASVRDEGGQLLGALVIGWDVTRVRQMEQQVHRVERLAAMGKLAAGAAHEIRNPLAAIRGFVQLLQLRQDPAAPEAEYAQIILAEIDRIEAIVRDLLLLGRPAEPVRAPLDLAALLDDALLLMGDDLRRTAIDVVRAYMPDRSPALGDARLLKQVALNLLRNAAEAMAAGGRLTLAAGGGPPAVWFQVRDTGVGIAPADLDRLFTPFFTTKESGTGLGLAICYALVSAHGGRIEVESEPGAGTAVTVWLPAAAGRAPVGPSTEGGTAHVRKDPGAGDRQAAGL